MGGALGLAVQGGRRPRAAPLARAARRPLHDAAAPIEAHALDAPKFEYFYKPLGKAEWAVLLMNHDDAPQDLALSFADVPGLSCTKCALSDVWAYGKSVGTFDTTYTAKAVGAHDAVFLTITPAAAVEPRDAALGLLARCTETSPTRYRSSARADHADDGDRGGGSGGGRRLHADAACSAARGCCAHPLRRLALERIKVRGPLLANLGEGALERRPRRTMSGATSKVGGHTVGRSSPPSPACFCRRHDERAVQNEGGRVSDTGSASFSAAT